MLDDNLIVIRGSCKRPLQSSFLSQSRRLHWSAYRTFVARFDIKYLLLNILLFPFLVLLEASGLLKLPSDFNHQGVNTHSETKACVQDLVDLLEESVGDCDIASHGDLFDALSDFNNHWEDNLAEDSAEDQSVVKESSKSKQPSKLVQTRFGTRRTTSERYSGET